MLINGAWLLTVLLGHFGIHLTFYNRINATAFQRWNIKLIERLAGIECFVLPLPIARAAFSEAELPAWLVIYATICFVAIPVLGIPWCIYRPIFRRDWLSVNSEVKVYNLWQELDTVPYGSLRCRLNAMLPGNQIFQLAVESKRLPVLGLPEPLQGLRIAHLSDVHLTGHALPCLYRFVASQLMQFEPDIVCLTGDIIDRQRCIAWLDDCFGDIEAPYGCYFILGNHDTRVAHPDEVRGAMEAIGWTDVGGQVIPWSIRGTQVSIIGNELPWFDGPPATPNDDESFRLLLSHSPDQIQWARQNGVHLMLAGHTHGGHGRLPLVGPLISPSRYGSRFASGEFRLSPTTMHVTRGIFGTHLQRINCRPELSLLTLTADDQADPLPS